ncbi:MAG TPA: ATP-binding cassette domain-containing protein [Methanoregulaceae archaeon]|nr:ATP-binding cassette domain-containing protein [Methanolinea sp.]HNY89517.1 ATP-binding cassette domain-containing protein [Methanoregulaceae archaeon]HOB58875.1 ATP-binding cassette domain-containing protein [Methanoregulaceae archaeon]HOH81064.1 ATP-binding cassette domain-containing protein [Methanoregulaceae archaeon]HOW33393.1 ATP-binding cassette domain-containing protein [Methanoregulaceae archaeon]
MPDAIVVADLTKVFGSTVAVDHVSFLVKEGEIFGFLGPNGAGKTTTTRMLTGVIPPDSGSAMILGHDIQREPVLAKQGFGVVPETSNAYTDLTAWQNLMLMGELYGISPVRVSERASELLTVLGLFERKDQKVQAYSKGMKQRLILAMALLHEPRLLFLDEPTSGLDVQSTQMILSLLRDLNRAGTTIFLTTHNMEEANRLCNRVGIIRSGKIVALDAPEKLKAAIDRLHRIEVSFDREIPADALARLPGVVSADRTGDKWQITTENHDAVIRLLVQFSREQGAAIVTLNTLAPSLDDAFLRLTREASP